MKKNSSATSTRNTKLNSQSLSHAFCVAFNEEERARERSPVLWATQPAGYAFSSAN